MNDFQNMPVLMKEDAQKLLDICSEIIKVNIPAYTYRCQNHSSIRDIYPQCDNNQWSCGFWPGELWLAYEHTGGAAYRDAAEELVKSFYNRIINEIEVDHQDLGVLYTPSCVAAYQLTESERAREAALLAAKHLTSRFHENGNFIRTRGEMGKTGNYGLSIDSLMNLPLLFWTREVTGEDIYEDIAKKHLETALRYTVSESGGIRHLVCMDKKTGKPVGNVTEQGYDEKSVWTRGQAWGIYGTALSHRYTQNRECKKAFYTMLDYYLAALPRDMVPFWDLVFTDGDDEPRDSSSASITVCGMLEMAEYADRYERKRLLTLSGQMLKSLASGYAVKSGPQGVGLVRHGTYRKKSAYNTCVPEGVDECLSWGDYFYMEALTRYHRDWGPYW